MEEKKYHKKANFGSSWQDKNVLKIIVQTICVPKGKFFGKRKQGNFNIFMNSILKVGLH